MAFCRPAYSKSQPSRDHSRLCPLHSIVPWFKIHVWSVNLTSGRISILKTVSGW